MTENSTCPFQISRSDCSVAHVIRLLSFGQRYSKRQETPAAKPYTFNMSQTFAAISETSYLLSIYARSTSQTNDTVSECTARICTPLGCRPDAPIVPAWTGISFVVTSAESQDSISAIFSFACTSAAFVGVDKLAADRAVVVASTQTVVSQMNNTITQILSSRETKTRTTQLNVTLTQSPSNPPTVTQTMQLYQNVTREHIATSTETDDFYFTSYQTGTVTQYSMITTTSVLAASTIYTTITETSIPAPSVLTVTETDQSYQTNTDTAYSTVTTTSVLPASTVVSSLPQATTTQVQTQTQTLPPLTETISTTITQ